MSKQALATIRCRVQHHCVRCTLPIAPGDTAHRVSSRELAHERCELAYRFEGIASLLRRVAS